MSTMKLPSLLLRPVSHLSSNHELAIVNEALTLIDTVSPMEPALEPLVPFLSPESVTSVIKEQKNPQLGFRFFIWTTQKKRFCSKSSNDLIIDMLCKGNGFDLYWQTIDELKNRGISIASLAFGILIAGYAKMGFPEKAVESFNKMKDFQCKPDVFTYNRILHLLFSEEMYMLALAVYNQMLKSNCVPDRHTFSIMIDGLGKGGNTEEALEMFDDMTQRGISPNEYIYSIIISGLCRVKRVDDALRLFNSIRESGRYVNVVVYVALMNGFCKVGRFDEAFALLQSFKKDGFVLGVHGYSTFIDGFFRARRYEEAYGLYRNMLMQKVKPDIVLYTIMIRGLTEEGKVRDAWNLMSEMTDEGVVPDSTCYNTMIKGFCDGGLLDEARSLHLEISKRDGFPDASTYTILICGMCRSGLVGEAQQIFSEMEKLGCLPSVVTFNALIDLLCKTGNIKKAHLLFYKMEIGRNPSLFLRLSQGTNRVIDSAGLQSMVEQFCESGLILKAYKLLTQLAESSVIPDIRTYNILINAFGKAGNINGALKLFKDLQMKGLSADVVTYGTLIDALQRADRETDAFGVFDLMVTNGCTPSATIYNTLMTWSCRRKKLSLAFSLWLKYLRTLAGVKDGSIEAVEELLGGGDLTKAVQRIIEMDHNKSNDFTPCTIMLIGFCQAGRDAEALKIFSVLKECKVTVTPPSCVHLVSRLCRARKLDLAVDVFLYALEKGFKLVPRICNRLLRCLLHSEDMRDQAFDILERMEHRGYDLDVYVKRTTRNLLRDHWETWNKIENGSPG